MVSGGRPPQPFVKDCDQHGRLVADGELVVARGAWRQRDVSHSRFVPTVVALVKLNGDQAAPPLDNL